MNKLEQKAYHKAYREANKENRKAYLEANKEKIAKQSKAYREANKEKIAKRMKAYREANREKIKKQAKEYREAKKEKIKERDALYREKNKEKIAEYKKNYQKKNKRKTSKQKLLWLQNKLKSNPFFRLVHNYRRSCNTAFEAIGQKKNNKSLKLLGLKNWEKFAEHLSEQFYDHPETGEKMTFDNHGFYGWHIDHIIPLDSAKTEEDIIKLCHYTNLQPLWAEENLSKGSKILFAE